MNEQAPAPAPSPEPSSAIEVQAAPALDPKPPITGPKAPLSVGETGIRITNTDDAMRFCQILVRSGFSPKGIDSPEKAFVCLQLGAELGIPPMAAIQNIAVINGRPAVWGDMMLALCRSSGLCPVFKETEVGEKGTDSHGWVVTTQRRGTGEETKSVFTVEDAKRAGLWGKAGPWTQYPSRMLKMRARSFCLRDAYPDVLKGVVAVEEANDLPPIMKDVTPKLDDL